MLIFTYESIHTIVFSPMVSLTSSLIKYTVSSTSLNSFTAYRLYKFSLNFFLYTTSIFN